MPRVSLRRLLIRDSEGSGVYLETGSRDNAVEDSTPDHNGFDESTDHPMVIAPGAVKLVIIIQGREALVTDGSRNNVIRRNVFRGNRFVNVRRAVRIEDDGAIVEDNRFVSRDTQPRAIILGTEFRTEVLGEPVPEPASLAIRSIFPRTRDRTLDSRPRGHGIRLQ